MTTTNSVRTRKIPGKDAYETKGMLDHISFHKNGTIHTTHKRYKNDKYHHKEKPLKDNLFRVAKYGFHPLLMESFYFHEEFNKTLPLYYKYNEKEKKSKLCFRRSWKFQFSIIYMQKC